MVIDATHHISEHDLEQYCRGNAKDGEMSLIIDHVSWCLECGMRLKQTERYLAAVRAASIAQSECPWNTN
jgi:hypothetical protein